MAMYYGRKTKGKFPTAQIKGAAEAEYLNRRQAK